MKNATVRHAIVVRFRAKVTCSQASLDVADSGLVTRSASSAMASCSFFSELNKKSGKAEFTALCREAGAGGGVRQ